MPRKKKVAATNVSQFVPEELPRPMQPGDMPLPVMQQPSDAAPQIMQQDAPAQLTDPALDTIGLNQIRQAAETLRKYKQGKESLENKIIKNEKWWKIRHWDMLETPETRDNPKPASAWLFNTIISKHADFMDSFPDAAILPREPGDQEEAKRLSSVIPVVLDQNGFRKVYSDEIWYKLKHGTGVYGIFWDADKLNGLGDISIKSMDILSLFWEPGVTDIQDSRNFFSVELVDNDVLKQQYPQLQGKLSRMPDDLVKKYWYDDNIDTTGKTAVVDWYYKKKVNGQNTVQYCKFAGDTVLFATENDPALASKGLYDHGMYPFVFDTLFPEAGMPVGFGFVDVCKNPQLSIDLFNDCFERNMQYVCSPRYITRNDGGINEEEFADPNKLLIHADAQLGEDSFKALAPPQMITGNYLSMLDAKINEMKETAGNRDATNGGAPSGMTAASAIAALQESSGKTSRDQINTTFDAYKQVVTIVIELIRQFYTLPRQFRITGEQGQMDFAEYDNANLQPQALGSAFGEELGYRLPVFDIDVKAEKSSSYSKLSQNEMALQFYNSGFFNPQYADQALACIDMMDFQGKQQMSEKIQQNGTMYQQLLQMQQQMLQMAQMVDQLSGQTNLAASLSGEINQQLDRQSAPQAQNVAGMNAGQESSITQNARKRAAEATAAG